MSELTITQVKEEKHKLEAAIAELAIAFTKKTGVVIDDIDMSVRIESMQNGVEAYLVLIDIRL